MENDDDYESEKIKKPCKKIIERKSERLAKKKQSSNE